MKIVVLMGSPRKKDGYKVCEKVRESLEKKVGKALEFEYIMLKKLNLEECRGCELCLTKGEKFCPIKDEASMLVEKMKAADGLILLSPVYACQVSATFKKMVDRLSYLFHRPELVEKPVITILTTAGGGIKATNSYLKLVAQGWGCQLVGSIQVACTRYFDGRWECPKADERYQQQVNAKIEKLTSKWAVEMNNRKKGILPKPSLYEVYMFSAMRSKIYTSKADFAYWTEKGWTKSNYYYETQLPTGGKLVEKIMDKIVEMMIKKMGVE